MKEKRKRYKIIILFIALVIGMSQIGQVKINAKAISNTIDLSILKNTDAYNLITLPLSPLAVGWYSSRRQLAIQIGYVPGDVSSSLLYFYVYNGSMVVSPESWSAMTWYPYQLSFLYDFPPITSRQASISVTMCGNKSIILKVEVRNKLSSTQTIPFMFVFKPETYIHNKNISATYISSDDLWIIEVFSNTNTTVNNTPAVCWWAIKANIPSVAHTVNETLSNIETDLSDGSLDNVSYASADINVLPSPYSLFVAFQWNFTIEAGSSKTFEIAISFGHINLGDTKNQVIERVKNVISTGFSQAVTNTRQIWEKWFAKLPQMPPSAEIDPVKRWWRPWCTIFQNLYPPTKEIPYIMIVPSKYRYFGVYQHDTGIVVLGLLPYFPELAKQILYSYIEGIVRDEKIAHSFYPILINVGKFSYVQTPILPIVVWRYYVFTLDKDTIFKFYNKLKKYLIYINSTRFVASYGLYKERVGADESIENTWLIKKMGVSSGTYIITVSFNAYMYASFKAMEKMALYILNNKTEAQYWNIVANRLKNNFNIHLWNGSYYFPIDLSTNELKTEWIGEGGLYAISLGLVPSDRIQTVLDFAYNAELEHTSFTTFDYSDDFIAWMAMFRYYALEENNRLTWARDLINKINSVSTNSIGLSWHGCAFIHIVSSIYGGLRINDEGYFTTKSLNKSLIGVFDFYIRGYKCKIDNISKSIYINNIKIGLYNITLFATLTTLHILGEELNITSLNFMTQTKLCIVLSASGTDSVTVIYTANYGKPTKVIKQESGTELREVPSLSDLERFTDCWYYDYKNKLIYVKVKHYSPATIIVDWSKPASTVGEKVVEEEKGTYERYIKPYVRGTVLDRMVEYISHILGIPPILSFMLVMAVILTCIGVTLYVVERKE